MGCSHVSKHHFSVRTPGDKTFYDREPVTVTRNTGLIAILLATHVLLDLVLASLLDMYWTASPVCSGVMIAQGAFLATWLAFAPQRLSTRLPTVIMLAALMWYALSTGTLIQVPDANIAHESWILGLDICSLTLLQQHGRTTLSFGASDCFTTDSPTRAAMAVRHLYDGRPVKIGAVARHLSLSERNSTAYSSLTMAVKMGLITRHTYRPASWVPVDRED